MNLILYPFYIDILTTKSVNLGYDIKAQPRYNYAIYYTNYLITILTMFIALIKVPTCCY